MNNQKTNQNKDSMVLLGNYCSDKFSVALADYNFGLRQNWHKHDDFILAMTLKGYVREQVKSEDTTVKPFAVGIKPADIRHTDHFCSRGVRAVKISLSSEFFSELEIHSLIREKWDWIDNSQATRPFLRVVDNLLHHKSNETDISEGVYEILAAILPAKHSHSASHAPLWLRRARENLDISFTEGLRLTRLADEAGVHPVYFARQFRRFFGCSVGRYIRQLQFQKAANLLTNHQDTLAGIAYQVGCSDQAHLSRIFVNEFGVTPGHFRKLIK